MRFFHHRGRVGVDPSITRQYFLSGWEKTQEWGGQSPPVPEDERPPLGTRNQESPATDQRRGGVDELTPELVHPSTFSLTDSGGDSYTLFRSYTELWNYLVSATAVTAPSRERMAVNFDAIGTSIGGF